MFLRFLSIPLAVMFRGGTVRLGSVIMVGSRFLVRVLSHVSLLF
jgi:hypothetical protein